MERGGKVEGRRGERRREKRGRNKTEGHKGRCKSGEERDVRKKEERVRIKHEYIQCT